MKKMISLAICGLLSASPVSFAQTTTARPALTAPTPAGNALPSGTVIKMKLETGVSTAVSKVGDGFTGRVTEDVVHNGATVIPVGASIAGTLTKVDEKRRYKGRPVLEMRPETVTLPNGEKYNLNAVITGTERGSGVKVDNEGRIKGGGMERRDKLEIAGGSGAGALVGGLSAQSAKGTLIGAVIGGGAAVGYWLSKHKSASLAAGTEIMMELSRPMALTEAGD